MNKPGRFQFGGNGLIPPGEYIASSFYDDLSNRNSLLLSINYDLRKERDVLQDRLAEREAQLAEYENIIIPSWKREEDMWREDEANAIEFRRVLAEELDKRDADIARLKAWLRDYQPCPADSASAQESDSHG